MFVLKYMSAFINFCATEEQYLSKIDYKLVLKYPKVLNACKKLLNYTMLLICLEMKLNIVFRQ